MSPCSVRVKALAWPACAVAGAMALASVVSAQTLPVPTLPPEPPPEVDTGTPGQEPADAQSVAPGSARDRWEYNLAVGAIYDSNVSFRVPDGPSSWAVSPRGGLARVFTGQQGELRLGAKGSWRGYRSLETLNRYNAGADLTAHYRSSPATTWQASASYDLGHSDSSPLLTDQGVLLPLVRTRTATGRLGVDRTLGQHTSFRLQGRIHHVEFDQEDARTYSLVDGQSLRGTAALHRTLGQRDSGAIEYSFGATLSGRPALVDEGRTYYFTHFGSLQWNHVLGRRSALMLEGGASYTPETAEARLAGRTSFYGGASYSHQLRRSDLTLFVRREVTPAFGLGVSRVQTRFGIAATFRLGRAWGFEVRGTHVELDTPDEGPITYGTPDEVSARLSRKLGRHFAFSGEGRYRRRGAVASFPAIDAYEVGLVLSAGGG